MGESKKDPEEEYFRLVSIINFKNLFQTVLAVKILHNEQNKEFVYDVSK